MTEPTKPIPISLLEEMPHELDIVELEKPYGHPSHQLLCEVAGWLRKVKEALGE